MLASRIVLAVTTFILAMVPVVSVFPNIGPEFNGMTLHFHRRFEVAGIPLVKYIHKGILFFPGSCDCPYSQDSNGRPIYADHPYVIHLWGPGMSKRKSWVRIDPLEEVIQGDRVDIVHDLPGALPCDQVMDRAFSEFGTKHRGLEYNLAANNCGSFVGWAKYGNSESDVQFWDQSKRIVNKFLPLIGPKLVDRVAKFVRRGYARWEQ